MYNGIGLTTPRGSGTNGHVQRNWAFVRPNKRDNSNYRSEEDPNKLDATLNRLPNKDILDHDRKRKIEVKCLEFEEILEKQGLSSEEIQTKVNSYRQKLMGQGKTDLPKDEFGRIIVRDTHQIAEAQQEKNAKLREAFNISEYFVEGSSFDSDRKEKEDLAKGLALQKELDAQREQAAVAAAKDKESVKPYALVRTPSMEHEISSGGAGGCGDNDESLIKKKKKKKMRESPNSPERKKDKKKKSKKRKKESKSKKSKKLRKRKESESESNGEHDKDSIDENSDSDSDNVKKSRKKSKKEKKKRDKKNKKKDRSSSSDKSGSISPVYKLAETKKESKKTESIKRKKNENPFRSRSKDKSYKSKESHIRNFETQQDSNGRRSRSRSRSDKISTKRRSRSNSDKSIYYRRSRSGTERNFTNACHRDEIRDYSHMPSISSTEYRSSERINKHFSNRDTVEESGDQNSRSRRRSRRDDRAERPKDLKRKHSEELLKRKHDGSSLEKRNKYSCSPTNSYLSYSHDKKSSTKSTQRNQSQPRARSRTPGDKSTDRQLLHKRVNKSRSGSSIRNMRKSSLTPPPPTSKRIESKDNDSNVFNHQVKSCANLEDSSLKITKNDVSRSKSRTTSSSDPISFTGTESSISGTTSPKKKYLEKRSESRQKKSQSPKRTPSPSKRRSTSSSKTRQILNERGKSKENRVEYIKCKSKTPPSSKEERKKSSSRSSRNSSELSYSPARRDPERYRDIMENGKNQKPERRKPSDKEHAKISKRSEEREKERKDKGLRSDRNSTKPVVRLQSQSEDDSDSVERNAEKILDEFQESKRERELRDLKMLEHLKSGIAAKAKEKIKTIEKMAASTLSCLSNTGGEVSDKPYKREIRNSLNDFLAANNAAPAVVATCSSTTHINIESSPPGAIYPQTLEEITREQESFVQLQETSSYLETNNNLNNQDNETQANCKKSPVAANGHVLTLSPTASQVLNIVHVMNKDRDRKRERDNRERERERDRDFKISRENIHFNKERYLEKRQRTSPNIYSAGGIGACGNGGGSMGGGNSVGRRNNTNIHHINHRQLRLNGNIMGNSGGVGVNHHHHSHLHSHHHNHHPNHQIINNHHNVTLSSSTYIANNASTNPHTLICNHANNSTNIIFNRPSRINNTPLITATQFNNQMISKQSNSILVNRRDHRTALNLGLSGTPCTNFSNSNLLLTKANTNTHHLHVAGVGGGQHHYHHHHHHHGQNSSANSGGHITDRILMAASIAAAQRHSLGVVHSTTSSAAAVAAVNNLNFLHQQNKPKLVIKPFKINDSQPLVAALADSSLVDAIVSKVSTATVLAAESAARRSRSRSRHSRSRNHHEEKTSNGGGGNNGGEIGERDGNRRRTASHSRSSRSSSSSRSRSRSRRSSRSHSSQSSSSSRSSSPSSSSSSFGSSRSGTRSPSIPRRRGSPSFLDRRRITSARKRPIPYHRKLPSDISSCYCSSCCSRDSSPHSRSPSRDSRSPSRIF